MTIEKTKEETMAMTEVVLKDTLMTIAEENQVAVLEETMVIEEMKECMEKE